MAPDSLLDTIIAITEQRDQQSLELSLLASLREMLQPRCAYLLDLPLHGPARALAPVTDAELRLPESLLKVARNLSEFEIRKADANAITYLMATTELDKNGRRRVLLVGMPGWSDSNERLLMGMVRVYQNFMQLMSDSEKDTLTGLQNRRKLESYLARACPRDCIGGAKATSMKRTRSVTSILRCSTWTSSSASTTPTAT